MLQPTGSQSQTRLGDLTITTRYTLLILHTVPPWAWPHTAVTQLAERF